MITDYRFNFDMVSYSEIKCFSKCPRLYFEQYILQTYKQEDKDYFIYGQVADTLLTQPWLLEEKFVRVSKKTNGGYLEEVAECQALEQKITDLELELDAKPNKTKVKTLEKAKRELIECQARIAEVKAVEGRQQVTAAIWDNAHETAEAIQRNPFYAQRVQPLVDSEDTRCAFQQVIYDAETHGKGTLDVLSLSKEMQGVLDQFRTGKMEKEASQALAKTVADKSGFIADIKTTFDMSKLAPGMYGAQLAYYQYILNEILGIKLPCYAIVGDKRQGMKVAQDFVYSQAVLDRELAKLLHVRSIMLRAIELWKTTNEDKWFPPAKSFRQKKQDCFTCSGCSDRPFSHDAPYNVTLRDVMDYERIKR